MKFVSLITITLLLSSPVFAATEINAVQADMHNTPSLGSTFLGHDVNAISNALDPVNTIADNWGAKAYQIEAMHEPGSNNSMDIVAILYK